MTSFYYGRRRALVCLLVAASLGAGCAGTGDIQSQSTPIEPGQAGLQGAAAADWPTDHWWRAFGDPQLERLIEAAGAGNPSIKIAEARVRQAQQYAVFVGADTDPNIALNANLNRQRFPEHYIYPSPLGGSYSTDARLALDFSYEFDFWGRQRSLLESARKQIEAELAERESARLVLAVAVTQTYLALQRSNEELALARDAVKQRGALHALYELRVRQGLSSRVEAEPYIAGLARARQDEAAAQQNIDLLKHQLAALTGQGPEALADMAPPRVEPGALALPTALPADLLGRRPDIVARRLRVEAAARDIAAARADFYPNVDLTAFFGFQSLGTDQLLKAGSRTYGVGPALHLPIFNRSTLRAQLGESYADYDLAVEQYNQTVLDAARAVADQGATLKALAQQRAAADSALAARQRAYDLAQLRRQRGLASELEVLNAETGLLAEKQTQAALRERELQAALALIKALGGGYTDPAQSAANDAR